MAKISIDVPEQVRDDLRALVDLCQTENSTHGPLTVAKLLAMLAEDAALVLRRPGCWEAEKMSSLLSSHGYGV